MLTRRHFLTALAGTFSLGGLVSAYGMAIEPLYRLRTQRYAFTPKDWAGRAPLRIVALSDFHFCEPWMNLRRGQEIVAAANSLGGDIIVLLGDYISSMRLRAADVPMAEWSALLGTLKAPLGVHAVLGNHDWWGDAEAMRRRGGPTKAGEALEQVGIRLYENDVLHIAEGRHRFWLAGLGDQISFLDLHRRDRSVPRGVDDLAKVLGAVSGDDPVILMAHEPDIFPKVPPRVSLTLSGHTHGGQVRLFGFSPIVPSRFGRRYAYGHIVEDQGHLVVSGGLGCSQLPVRIGVPPEITVIEIGG